MFDLIDVVLVVVGVLDSAVGLLAVVVHFVACVLAFVARLVLAIFLLAIHHLLVFVAGAVLLAGGGNLLCVFFEKQSNGSSEKLETNVLFVLALTAGLQELFELFVGGLSVVVHHLLKQNLKRLQINVCFAK
jgi:hypothetical protein